jgi:hypothetical protein
MYHVNVCCISSYVAKLNRETVFYLHPNPDFAVPTCVMNVVTHYTLVFSPVLYFYTCNVEGVCNETIEFHDRLLQQYRTLNV